jgi:MSHA biogenesis protein MshO
MQSLYHPSTKSHRGFTMIEMVMVIVIMGVIGGMVAVFLKGPIDSYADSGRRAALTDVADTSARRMARDISKALPNSIRQVIGSGTPDTNCIEFIPTKTGGRYRADDTAQGLDFALAAGDTTFNMLSDNSILPVNQRIGVGDVIAIYNLGITGATAYNGDNTSPVTLAPTLAGTASAPETALTFTAKQFPLPSPGNRFQVIPAAEKVVSYVCSGGRLLRSANHAYTTICPTAGATVSVMATHIGSCSFVYNGSDLQRNALVQLNLTFTKEGESVSLYHEVHVDNTP